MGVICLGRKTQIKEKKKTWGSGQETKKHDVWNLNSMGWEFNYINDIKLDMMLMAMCTKYTSIEQRQCSQQMSEGIYHS